MEILYNQINIRLNIDKIIYNIEETPKDFVNNLNPCL